jgi:hypothetical protein
MAQSIDILRAMTPPAPTRRLVLRFKGKDVVLPQGRSVIGRSDACRIVIDDASVSRRHAGIDVDGAKATLVDLDSANGVSLNGDRVGRTPVPIRDGDVITIGGWTLRVQQREVTNVGAEPPPGSRPRGGVPGVTKPPSARGPNSRRGRADPTRVSGATELVFRVAGQALDSGRVADAIRVVRDHLASVLEGTRLGNAVEETRPLAIAFALRLAHETRDGEWLDYVVDLLHAGQTVCSPEIAEKLQSALQKVSAVDANKLQAYATLLRATSPNLDGMRAAQSIEQLARAAARKHRPSSLRPRVSAIRGPRTNSAPPSSSTG